MITLTHPLRGHRQQQQGRASTIMAQCHGPNSSPRRGVGGGREQVLWWLSQSVVLIDGTPVGFQDPSSLSQHDFHHHPHHPHNGSHSKCLAFTTPQTLG